MRKSENGSSPTSSSTSGLAWYSRRTAAKSVGVNILVSGRGGRCRESHHGKAVVCWWWDSRHRPTLHGKNLQRVRLRRRDRLFVDQFVKDVPLSGNVAEFRDGRTNLLHGQMVNCPGGR